MKNYMDIIRGLREDRDLKQSEIADVIGTTQQHYSKYETGEYELPIRALVLLAEYFGVSTDYLLGRVYRKDDLSALDRKVNAERTAGEVIADVFTLSPKGRASVIEYIRLQIVDETNKKKKE